MTSLHTSPASDSTNVQTSASGFNETLIEKEIKGIYALPMVKAYERSKPIPAEAENPTIRQEIINEKIYGEDYNNDLLNGSEQ